MLSKDAITMCRFPTCNHPLPVGSGPNFGFTGWVQIQNKFKIYNMTVGSIYQGMHCTGQGTGDEFHCIFNFIATS